MAQTKTKTITRKADANWKGDVKNGHGLVSTESGTLREAEFSLGCRFDGEARKEVNPEELIAAAAASCFSMALSKTLTDMEKVPTKLVVKASVGMTVEDSGPRLHQLLLFCEGSVDGLEASQFGEALKKTRESCPVLRVLEPGFDQVEVEGKLIAG